MSLYGKRSTKLDIDELHLKKNLIVDNEDDENLELKGNEILISNSKNHDKSTVMNLYHYGSTTGVRSAEINLITKNSGGGTTRAILKQYYGNYYSTGWIYHSLLESSQTLTLSTNYHLQKFYLPNDSGEDYYIRCADNADLTTFLEKKYHFLYNNTQYDLIKERFKIDDEETRLYTPGFDNNKTPGKYELYIKDKDGNYKKSIIVNQDGNVNINYNTRLRIFRAYSNQSIPYDVDTVIEFNEEESDINNEYLVSESKFFPNHNSIYSFQGSIRIYLNYKNDKYVTVYMKDNYNNILFTTIQPHNAFDISIPISFSAYLFNDRYYQFYIYDNDGLEILSEDTSHKYTFVNITKVL